ncbi:MAG TPA: vWA domain-containing protein [Polyangiaceae bacterium]|nr:vWA domain-containing protein [Polyangiaceae bacterium]
MKTTAFLSCISSLALSLACASTKEGSNVNPGAAGTGGSAGSVSLVVGGDTGGAAGTGAKTGGVVTLTPEQVTAINNNACEGWSAEPESKPAVLEFVVDTSLSMNEVPGATTQPGRPGSAGNGPTKWQSTRDALKAVISTLPDSIAAGLLFYPNMANQARSQPASPDTCVNTRAGIAPAPLDAAQKANLIAALDATNPNGWTPTDAAYQHALQAALLPTRLPGDKYVVLITDGQPTLRGDCTSAGGGMAAGITPVESQPIIDHVAAALGQGVRTFLIGSPGSEGGRAWMSEAAIVGGTAAAGCKVMGPPFCHLDMTTASDFGVALKAGLNKVTGSIACTYDIPDPGQGQVIDTNLINLVVTTASGTQLVLPDEGTDCDEGFRLAGNQVVLCEGTCSRVQRDHDSIQLLFGCQSGMIGVPK